MMRCRLLLHSAVFGFGLLISLRADIAIHWSGPAGEPYWTKGDEPLGSSFVWELGAFKDDFQPSRRNFDQWAAYWVPLDRVAHDEVGGGFARTTTLRENSNPFTANGRAYIWGYALRGESDWVLLKSDAWTWPDLSDSLSFPRFWQAQTAQTVVGEMDPDGNPFFLRTERFRADPPRVYADDWLAAVFSDNDLDDPAISEWDRDPDGDGWTNLVEMGLGTNPLVSEAERRDAVVIAYDRVADGHHLRVEVKRNPMVTARIQVAFSVDRTNWSTAAEEVEILEDRADRLVVRDRFAIEALGKRFARVEVVLQD